MRICNQQMKATREWTSHEARPQTPQLAGLCSPAVDAASHAQLACRYKCTRSSLINKRLMLRRAAFSRIWTIRYIKALPLLPWHIQHYVQVLTPRRRKSPKTSDSARRNCLVVASIATLCSALICSSAAKSSQCTRLWAFGQTMSKPSSAGRAVRHTSRGTRSGRCDSRPSRPMLCLDQNSA